MGTSSNFGNMLSMALASLVLPFLPLLPVQILLNNLLYDFSEIGIPFDSVDREDLARPRAWDMGDILRFTLVMGALSSLFDAATFAILRLGFDAGPELFRTAWFVESTATQILVIFIIRTHGAAWASRAASGAGRELARRLRGGLRHHPVAARAAVRFHRHPARPGRRPSRRSSPSIWRPPKSRNDSPAAVRPVDLHQGRRTRGGLCVSSCSVRARLPMIQQLSNLRAMAPLVTGAYIMLMALLLGNAARLSRRQTCRIRARPRRSRETK